MTLVKEKQLIAITNKEQVAQEEIDVWLDFFSIFIHDIESPLASLKYLVKLVEEGKLNTANRLHRDMVRSAKIALDRAESILYDIMAVARAGKAGIPVALEILNPESIIEEAVALAEGSAWEHKIKISYSNEIEQFRVKADPKLLKRVLDNLLFNAIRHTPSDGFIKVYTEAEETCIFIHVKDSGPGLGDIEPDKLFEKYGQIELRTRGKHRGVGLGLYFCKLAAVGMGGTIMADDHPDGGAVISIKLNKVEG
ncbi:MAG: HAMP domain-containing sensor histidine kinase [candidate division Zixibacteria bacterium]|nr:HAMP domain-containing sensor histidine kinase [candidate division Zixibacteria bacterium]